MVVKRLIWNDCVVVHILITMTTTEEKQLFRYLIQRSFFFCFFFFTSLKIIQNMHFILKQLEHVSLQHVFQKKPVTEEAVR